MVFIGLLIVPFAYALTGPISVSGTDYYVVTSTDPTEDTGNEVCAKLGQTCVGFTFPGPDVCLQNNPGASAQSGLSGDRSGVYCDGAPQSGVCAGLSNTCVTCAGCSVSVQCDTEIGSLYREMYVECTTPTPSCPVTLFARSTDQFFNEIPSLDAGLGACPVNLPSGSGFLVSSGTVQVDVVRNNGRTDSFSASVANKQVAGVSKGASSCNQKLRMSESVFDSILGSRDRGAAFMRAYGNKQVTLSGCTFTAKVFNIVRAPLSRFFVRRAAPPPPAVTPPANCGQLGEQCNNRACAQGLTCAAPREFVNGQWRPVDYRCIDNSQFQALCVGRGNTPAAWSCISGVAC